MSTRPCATRPARTVAGPPRTISPTLPRGAIARPPRWRRSVPACPSPLFPATTSTRPTRSSTRSAPVGRGRRSKPTRTHRSRRSSARSRRRATTRSSNRRSSARSWATARSTTSPISARSRGRSGWKTGCVTSPTERRRCSTTASGRIVPPRSRATTLPASVPSPATSTRHVRSCGWPCPDRMSCSHSRPRTTTSSRFGTRSRHSPLAPDRPSSSVASDLDELSFLNEIAQLATQARDWDELMRSIVQGTTAAMRVEVCSFYLANQDRSRLTLAATNGLDRTQVGKVSLAWGQGITGRVAESRQPIAVEDVTRDDRFSWVRGFDIEGLAGMLSVPLIWHDDVVGVLNVQTRGPRQFAEDEIGFLGTIAASLAGIVEKGRLTAEVEARLAELTALDAARSELLSVVTHELRTPLSVVRVYVDLLAEAAAANPSEVADPEAWRTSALEQLARLDRQVDSILASVRGEGLTGLSRAPFDAVEAVDETVETLRLPLPPGALPLG